MTFDFIMDARRDEVLMNKIKEHIFSEKDGEVCTEIYRLRFNGKDKKVIIEALSDTSPFHNKIVPKAINYETLEKVLDGNWDALENGVMDI